MRNYLLPLLFISKIPVVNAAMKQPYAKLKNYLLNNIIVGTNAREIVKTLKQINRR